MNSEQTKKRHASIRTAAGLMKYSVAVGLLITFIAIGFLVGGFLKFTDTIAAYKLGEQPEKAAGIAVYTGGYLRIEEASKLLRDGKGQRLLISGVNPKTSKKALLERSNLKSELFDCCVDIDKRAPDTRGNATETRIWAKKHKYDSLIIVTNNYHMPRSMLETRNNLPETKLVPYPVAAKTLDMENWYRDRQTIRHLLSEYSKYVAVQLRPVLAHKTIYSIRASLAGN